MRQLSLSLLVSACITMMTACSSSDSAPPAQKPAGPPAQQPNPTERSVPQPAAGPQVSGSAGARDRVGAPTADESALAAPSPQGVAQSGVTATANSPAPVVTVIPNLPSEGKGELMAQAPALAPQPAQPAPQNRTMPQLAAPADHGFALPHTKLSRLFGRLMDDSNNLDEIERTAGAIVAEVFVEDSQIRPKVWELQNLVKSVADDNRYNAVQSDKVRVLEAGLAQAAKNREYYEIGQDAAIILGSALGLAVLRGYHVAPPSYAGVRNTVSSAVTRAGEGISSAYQSTREAAGRVASWRPWRRYQESGQRVEGHFARAFGTVTPRDRLVRELSDLNLSPEQLAFLQSKILPDELADATQLAHYRFQKTNAANVRVSAVRYDPRRDDSFGYFVFEQKVPKVGRRGSTSYYRTSDLDENDMQGLLGKMFYGSDRRAFVELTPEATEAAGTAGAASAGRAAVDAIRNRVAQVREGTRTTLQGWRETIVGNFDTPRALQTLGWSTLALGTGYALGQDNDHFPDVYLESLLEVPARNVPGLERMAPTASDYRAQLAERQE